MAERSTESSTDNQPPMSIGRVWVIVALYHDGEQQIIDCDPELPSTKSILAEYRKDEEEAFLEAIIESGRPANPLLRVKYRLVPVDVPRFVPK